MLYVVVELDTMTDKRYHGSAMGSQIGGSWPHQNGDRREMKHHFIPIDLGDGRDEFQVSFFDPMPFIKYSTLKFQPIGIQVGHYLRFDPNSYTLTFYSFSTIWAGREKLLSHHSLLTDHHKSSGRCSLLLPNERIHSSLLFREWRSYGTVATK